MGDKNNHPLLSIVLPVYNVENYVDQAVETSKSLGSEVQIIIVNDGSTDGTEQTINKYAEEENISVYHCQHRGLGAARNAAIEMADGEYMMFLDGDDYFDIKGLRLITESLKQKKIDLLIFQWQLVSEKSEVMSLPNGSGDLDGMWLACWNKCYRRTIYSKLLFPEDVLFEDVSYAIRGYLMANSICFLKYPVIMHRHRNDSISRTKLSLKKRKDVLVGFSELYDGELRLTQKKVIDRIVVRTILTQVRKGMASQPVIDRQSLDEFRLFLLKNRLMKFHLKIRDGIWGNFRQMVFLWLIVTKQYYIISRLVRE